MKYFFHSILSVFPADITTQIDFRLTFQPILQYVYSHLNVIYNLAKMLIYPRRYILLVTQKPKQKKSTNVPEKFHFVRYLFEYLHCKSFHKYTCGLLFFKCTLV